MKIVTFLTDGTTVEVKLEDKVCLLFDESGKGKTFVLRRLHQYGLGIGKRYLFLEQSPGELETYLGILNRSNEDDIIMLDDDIEYSMQLINGIYSTRATVVCDIKSHSRFPAEYRKQFGRYAFFQDGTKLSIRRVGGENII